jgi:hypothetical protein
MATWLRILFLVHALIAAAVGVPLLLAPGRFLGWLGWAPVDPILSRVLGSALIALAWTSFRGWRATQWAQVAILVEAEALFAVLSCLGLLRHLIGYHYTLLVWGPFAVLLLFALAWIAAWVQHWRAARRQG